MILVFIGNDEEIRTVKAVTIETFGQNVQTSEKDTDITKPTLNASVSNGVLNIQVYDENSGVKAIYVNGYEFTEVINGRLTIRLQQFDVGYEYFYISAMDNARNLSEMYKIKNPYYSSLIFYKRKGLIDAKYTFIISYPVLLFNSFSFKVQFSSLEYTLTKGYTHAIIIKNKEAFYDT